MTERYTFEFGEWYPDLEDYAHDGLTEALNVVHGAAGYLSVGTASANVTTPLSSIITPTILNWQDSIGSGNLLGKSIVCWSHASGTTARFYETRDKGSSWSLRFTALSSGLDWGDIVQFEDYVVATKGDSNVYVAPYSSTALGVGTMTSVNLLSGGNSGCGPLGVVNNFVFACSTPLDQPPSVRWCAIGDPTDWPTPATDDARSKQSGEEILNVAYGEVSGVAGLEFSGYILQEKAITKATYVGGDVVFRFEVIATGVGCHKPNKFAVAEGMVFFESEFGYHVITRDGVVSDIGEGKVNDSYPPRDYVGAGAKRNRRTVHASPRASVVFFTSGLCYNYRTGRWTRIENLRPSWTGTGDDYLVGFQRTASASATISAGQTVGPLAFYDLYDGTVLPSASVLETAEREIAPGKRSMIHGVRPLITDATATSVEVQVGTRSSVRTATAYTTLSAVNSRTGFHNGRPEGAYNMIRVEIDNGFEAIVGVDVEIDQTGEN